MDTHPGFPFSRKSDHRIIGDDSEDEGDFLDPQGQWEKINKDEKEMYDGDFEDRMMEEAEDRVRREYDESVKEAEDFAKCMECMPMPKLEDDDEGWEDGR